MNRKRYLLIVFFIMLNILASNSIFELNLSEILKGYNFAIAPAENNLFFIADRNKQKVYVMDFSGKVSKSFGRRGEGPGEFRSIHNLLFIKEKLYVLDLSFLVHIFDKKGTFLRFIRLKHPTSNFKVLKGRIFEVVHEYKVEGKKVKVLDAIYLINEKGKVVKKIRNDNWLHKEMQTKGVPGSKNFVSWGWTHPYYPDMKIEVIKNSLVYCWTATNKLTFVDENGKEIKSIKVKALPPLKLTKAEIEHFRNLNRRSPSMFIPEGKASFYDFFYDRVRKVVVFVLPPSVVESQNGYPRSYEVVVTDLNFRPIKKLKIKIKRKGWGKVVGVYDGKILLKEPDEETDQIFLRFIDINLP